MNAQWQTGRGATYVWTPDARPAAAPDLKVYKPSGTITAALSKVRTPASVTAVGNDGRTLTLDAAYAGTSQGLVGDEGGIAWLDLGAAYQGPVKVLTFIDDDTVELAAPLRHHVRTDATGTLDWNVWEATLTSAQVGASVLRNVRLGIDWTTDPGDSRNGQPRHHSDAADIVVRPFDTGLSVSTLYAIVPALQSMGQAGQSGWGVQMRRALGDLYAWLTEALPSGRYPDQVVARDFDEVHALLAAHRILDGHRAISYDRETVDFRADAKVEFNRRMKRLRWLDADDDGVVDAGEVDAAVAGAPSILQAHVLESDWPTDDSDLAGFGVDEER